MGGLLRSLPFISMIYVIVGLANLGLPGMSGFVAEMNIFAGAFQHTDTFHRVVSILTISAIVVTAVYILRVVGMMLMGPIRFPEFKTLPADTWYERVGIYLLMIPIVGIGVLPLWLSNMLMDSIGPFIERLL
jgi:NADH-quinone oxidoreductase subunit M